MKKLAKIVLAAALIFTLVASSVFLIANSNHSCHGGKCTTCRLIDAAFTILKGIVVVCAVLLVRIDISDKKEGSSGVAAASEFYRFTPVFLKVKLND